MDEDLKDACFRLRGLIEDVKLDVFPLRTHKDAAGEAGANITLAYRHLEDARMRLGKAVQALDGGTSCYPK